MVGKEIKVTLSLDDSGFSIKTKVATDNVRTLEKNLGGLTSQVGKTESALKNAGSSVKGFSDGFDQLQKSLANSVSTLTNTVAASFDKLAVQSKNATKQVKDEATKQIEAKMAMLKAEVDTNAKILAARTKLQNDLKKAESEAKGRAIAAGAQKDALRASYMSAPIGSPGASYANYAIESAALDKEIALHRQNAEVMGIEAMRVNEMIGAMHGEQAARTANITSLEAERVAAMAAAQAKRQLAEISAAVGRSNKATVDKLRTEAAAAARIAAAEEKKNMEDGARLRKQLSDQQIRDDRAAAAARLAAAREAMAERRRLAAQEAAQARAEAQSIANMWKGMAKMYAGSKITHGVEESVGVADQYQRETTTAQAMNMTPDQLAEMNKLAWDDSKALKFVSALDMIQARLAAIGGMAEHANTQFIDKTLQYATTAAHNMQYITGDKSPEGMRDMVRNMYGVIEARQQTDDPEAAKRTIDLVQRMHVATGKKIDIKDLETYLRRDNTGNDKVSDEGLANMVAFLDQAKVSGGGMGGAGVSTVGTMVKMFQKMANGGTMTAGGAQEFAEAGLMDLSVMDGKQGKSAMRALRTGGLNVAGMANEDPVKALEMISKAALTYMTKPANLKKYFPDGADPKDPAAIKNAMMKFAIGTGWSTNAVAMLTTAGNSVAMERAHKQSASIMGSKNVPGMAEDVAKTYGANMDAFSASLTNLKMSVGNSVLPMLTKLMDGVKVFVDMLGDFAQNNPIATAATTIGTTFAGVILSVQGFLSMFGEAGVLGAIRAFIGLAPAVATGTGLMGMALKGLGTVFKGVMAVFMAWDIGYMFGTWLSTVDVFGVTIGDHVQNIFTNIEVAWKQLMLKADAAAAYARHLAHIDNDDEYAKKTADIDARTKALMAYQKAMIITADDKKPAPVVDLMAPPKPAPKSKTPVPTITSPTDAQLAKIHGAASGEKDDDEKRDPLNKALSEELGRMNSAKTKLDALVAGGETVDSMRQQAIDLVKGKLEADDLSKDHLAKNRPKLGMEDPTVKRLVDATANAMLYNEQQKAIEYANERVAATALEADSAMNEFESGGVAKQTDAFKALSKELARTEERLGAGTASLTAWAAAKDRALFNQARTDSTAFATKYKKQNESDSAALLPTERARNEARLAAARKVEEDEYAIRVAALDKMHKATRDSTLSLSVEQGDTLQETHEKALAVDTLYERDREKIDVTYGERRKIRAEQEARELESAASKMARDWQDTQKAMDDIGGNAMNSFVSMIMNSLETGHLAIKDFLKKILADIAEAKLKQALADPLKDSINAGVGYIGKTLFGQGGGAAASAASAASVAVPAAADAVKDVGAVAAEAERTAADSAAALAAGQRMAADTTSATASTGLGTAIMTMVIPALETFTAMLATASASSAASAGSSAIGAAVPAIAAAFANGGIMTDMGPVQLRKYANGGIANSPQLALYGEAGPEAYVPLPDGRTIPVTMNMSGASNANAGAPPSVSVNVINQTNQPVNAQQSNGLRFDGKQFVLDVVLSAATTPGAFRSSMKDALK